MYANIIIDRNHERVDRTFTYYVPEDMEKEISIGVKVKVPFGRGNNEIYGYVMNLNETTDVDTQKLKSIVEICVKDMDINDILISLAAYIRNTYGGTMIQALKTVLPVKKQVDLRGERQVRRIISVKQMQELYDEVAKKRPAQGRLLSLFLEEEVLPFQILREVHGIRSDIIRKLEKENILAIEPLFFYQQQGLKKNVGIKTPLNEEQKRAVDIFVENYSKDIHQPYLLYGITGSGKTEVYMEMIDIVIQNGKQAIVLIPEISLTYQTVIRFYQRFGNRISIMHSRLSKGEKYDQTLRAKNGEVDVVIGPRSALFTPLQELGIIVIDEEHEASYKSDVTPTYHAREVALQRAKLENADVVLGSATPSIDSYYRCQEGDYTLLTLFNRAGEGRLPKVQVVDMREEFKKGNRSILSDKVVSLLGDRLKKKQQSMLFLNRRGYAGFISCRACGHVVKCPHCDISLSSHANRKLICHYCGYEVPGMHLCPACGSKHLGEFRAGTQQIVEVVLKEFPEARVLRMDLDTTKDKDGHEKIIQAFISQEADILVGTQMIVKGHDFSNVTFVGVLAADMSLFANDYRCGERTYQLLTQAAGRAGRGEQEGEVVLQTYQPDHYSIQAALHQDYTSFYEQEISFRDIMDYPPVASMLEILLSSEDEKQLELASKYLSEHALRSMKAMHIKTIRLIGPTTPYVEKIKDVFRRVLYIKHDNYKELIELKDQLETYIEMNRGFANIRIQFDFNPLHSI